MLKKTVNLMPFRPAKIRGAGDVVHALAQPIARAVDAVAGTNLTNCGGCAQRRETLNQIIPMKKILSILSILSVVLTASAQRDWTLSTNNYWADTFVTNVFVGNTSTDPGRDTSLMAWQKINCDFNLIASWHALEAGALAYLDANAVTNTGTGYTLTGTWYGDGTALLINGTNLTAGTVNSNSLDADTITWLSSMGGGSGGMMNFDGGVIFSDGSGDIFTTGMYENTNVDGQFNIGGNNTATVNLSTYNGSATCQLNFYTFSFYGNQNGAGFESDTPACTFTFADQGNFCGLAEFNLNAGGNSTAGQITLVGIGSGGYDQSSGFGGMAVGADWSHGGFSMPDNGLIVEGNSGFCQQYPAYPVDAGGDINFTGDLRMNGTPIILPDSSGNGGTTLMLQAQDNGTPMYLHVQSDGSSAWTSSP